ncbi:unnamed protein product [Trichogramma brassicae]|uniref:CRAL-TRIO domain-containing protein n=1 Tax=Trichogramma brassicae TaxID=86971 RepID=A0A6H5IC36_9HYME|nr:unnamed protein product [Trichogramma brassicae]
MKILVPRKETWLAASLDYIDKKKRLFVTRSQQRQQHNGSINLVQSGQEDDSVEDRLLGARPAENGEFPYQASLRVGTGHICGAALIGKKHVLTAAHCLHALRDIDTEYVSVLVGTNDLRLKDGTAYPVRKMTYHPVHENEKKRALPVNETYDPTSMMILDLAMRDHVTSSLYGLIVIHDMKGVHFGHALQMTPGVIKRLVHTWQGYPNRLNSLDYVNAPTHVNVILSVFKRFMSKKLGERMHVHPGDGKSLLQKLSPDLLPKELGGSDSDYATLKSNIVLRNI